MIYRTAWLGSLFSILFLIACPPPSRAADARTLDALLDGVFAAHVVKGYVDYPEIARNVRFHKYVAALDEVNVDSFVSDAERLAFWLNVYNAVAVKMVTDGITPIDALGRIKFFRTTEHRIGGREYDLNEIGALLRAFGEPRVHFAMVNATYTAPNLRSGAYRGDEIDQQLDEAARDFINDKRKNRFSTEMRRAKLSKIFEEHADDFGGDKAAVLAYVARYIADEAVAEALKTERYDVKYLDDEWSINGRPM